MAALKTKSERLFEGYLRAAGFFDYEFEPHIGDSPQRPDYSIVWNEQRVLLEVKEFNATSDDFKGGFGAFDPYPPLREKINQARAKFKKLKDHCCALVLHNIDKPLILLDWKHIAAAMLGDLAFRVPLSLPGQDTTADEVHTVFSTGGKMHKEAGGVPYGVQNTSISAIVVLNRFPLGQRLFSAHIADIEARMGRSLSLTEHWEELERARGTAYDLRQKPLRVTVHENPYAKVKFPPDLFCGPYDKRYGDIGGRIDLLSQGLALRQLSPEDSAEFED